MRYGLFGINYKNNHYNRINNVNIYLINENNEKINMNKNINHELYYIEYSQKNIVNI